MLVNLQWTACPCLCWSWTLVRKLEELEKTNKQTDKAQGQHNSNRFIIHVWWRGWGASSSIHRVYRYISTSSLIFKAVLSLHPLRWCMKSVCVCVCVCVCEGGLYHSPKSINLLTDSARNLVNLPCCVVPQCSTCSVSFVMAHYVQLDSLSLSLSLSLSCSLSLFLPLSLFLSLSISISRTLIYTHKSAMSHHHRTITQAHKKPVPHSHIHKHTPPQCCSVRTHTVPECERRD